MKETNFTKGTWRIENEGEHPMEIVASDEYGDSIVCTVDTYDPDNTGYNIDETSLHDAYLIKSAPDMYEMLSLMTYLVRLKYGNSDKEIYEKVLEAEKLLAEAGGDNG